MLDKASLMDYVGDFNAYQTEKDYLQHIVLWRTYQSVSEELVFKGGTALQKAYNIGRFSEDLDFTAGNDAQKAIPSLLNKINDALKKVNYFYKTSYEKTINQVSISYKLKIEGPLYEKPQSIQTIKMEISTREPTILQPEAMPISPVYKDLGNYVVKMMNVEEMLAEKVRATMTRQKARDMYDIYFLVSKRVKLDAKLADTKLSYYKLKYDKRSFVARLAMLESVWNAELKPLMKNVPPFKSVLDYIKAEI